MNYKEVLDRVTLTGDIFYDDKVYLSIKKDKSNHEGIIENVASRELTEMEIMQYIFSLSKVLLTKKNKNKYTISNGEFNLVLDLIEIKE